MSLIYGDPDELDRLATVLDRQAAAVRQATTEQLRRACEADWVSDSAEAYQMLLARKCAEADRVAGGIEHAASALRAHAQRIRELLAAISRIERAVTEWFSAAARKLEELVEAGQLGPVRPPWLDWPYEPSSLPPPGDKRWLDVGRFMRGAGVL
jgi:hypothetical protein